MSRTTSTPLAAAAGPERVLLVDDSEVVGEILSYKLGDQGWEVDVVTSGRAALELVQSRVPHVVVCDLHMPEMDGFEVMRRLSTVDATIPFVMLTGDGDVETVLDAVHAGVFDFVPKSADAKVLIAAVRRALDHVRVLFDNRRLADELKNANDDLERRVEERTAELAESVSALNKSEARFKSLVQNASDIIAVVGVEGVLSYESPAVERLLGHAVDSRIGASVFEAIHPEDAEIARVRFSDALARPGRTTSDKLRFVHRDGSTRWMDLSVTSLVDDPSVGGVVWNCHDVTERILLEEQLTQMARYDGLTHLANRGLFRERVGQALDRARRAGEPLAVLFLDLDGFKAVNDSLGHAAGDQLLIEVAERLRACAPDDTTCSRLGGDEFAVLYGACQAEAEKLAWRIIRAVGAPFEIRRREVRVGASIGVAVSSAGHESIDELVRNADLAMYVAKSNGKGTCEVFQPSMHAAVAERMELELELRGALERQELFLQYQPTVEIQTGEIVGAEALVRWRHRERGIIPPGVFIPLAEETGLITPIGRWVLQQACAEAQVWRERYKKRFTMNVNVSPMQLRQGVIGEVEQALHQHAIDPALIVLELTESLALEEKEPTLSALRALGVKLAIDDFGTGYSSLGYLRRLRVDIVKIDKSFIDGIAAGGQDGDLARAVIQLGRAMGFRTTAEGIESVEQWRTLQTLESDYGQGFYFSRPVDGEAMHALLQRGRLREPPPQLAARSSLRPAPPALPAPQEGHPRRSAASRGTPELASWPPPG